MKISRYTHTHTHTHTTQHTWLVVHLDVVCDFTGERCAEEGVRGVGGE